MSTKHVDGLDESWFAPNVISNALNNLTSLATTYKAMREKVATSAKHEIEHLQKQQFDSPDSDRKLNLHANLLTVAVSQSQRRESVWLELRQRSRELIIALQT